jgi:hypothetical protein
MNKAIRKNKVVVLILVHKPRMTTSERCSLRQCVNVLGNYDIHIICPEGMNVDSYKHVSEIISFNYIDRFWQSSYKNFRRLKISPLLYRMFSMYEFVLFYELDAFVFRDELFFWCEADYDYIGAPWFEGFANCTDQSPFIGVGNGGFSLRKTSSALRVLSSFSYIRKPRELLWSHYDQNFFSPVPTVLKRRALREKIKLIKNLIIANNTYWILNDYAGPEDFFWGLFVPRSFSWFKVAPFEAARMFSVELNPALMYRLNKQKLPFGCHGWRKYDPVFWAPHIKKHVSLTYTTSP